MRDRMTETLDLLNARLSAGGHTKDIGLRLVAHGDNWAELAFDYDPRLASSAETGILASGPIVSLIDTASGAAIISTNAGMQSMATLDLRVDYMRAAMPGRTMHARATCHRVARNIAFVRCEAHDGDPGDLVATAMGSFYFTTE